MDEGVPDHESPRRSKFEWRPEDVVVLSPDEVASWEDDDIEMDDDPEE